MAKDFAAVQQMLTMAATPGIDGLRRYKKWTWYYTRDLTSLLTYLINILDKKSQLERLKFISTEQQEINSITYGQDLIDELANFFIVCNVFGDTGVELLYLIHSYLDKREASVCDLHISTPPTLENMDSLKLSVDKAYVRSGICGFMTVTESPFLKKVSSRNVNAIPEELRPTTLANVPKIIQQLYVLGPDNLYYSSDRNAELIPVIYNNIIPTLTQLWLQLAHSEIPVDNPIKFLSSEDQEHITENTWHYRLYKDQLFYINKTLRVCQALLIDRKQLNKFDEEMGISISNSVNRVLRIDELRKILMITKHNYHSPLPAIEEVKSDNEEIKDDEVASVPAIIQLPDKDALIKNLFKKLEANIALNRYQLFKKNLNVLLENGINFAAVQSQLNTSINKRSSHSFYQAVSTNNKSITISTLNTFLKKYQKEDEAAPQKKMGL